MPCAATGKRRWPRVLTSMSPSRSTPQSCTRSWRRSETTPHRKRGGRHQPDRVRLREALSASRIRRRQSELETMLPHLRFLVCANVKIAAGFGGAQEYEAGCAVPGKIEVGVARIEV